MNTFDGLLIELAENKSPLQPVFIDTNDSLGQQTATVEIYTKKFRDIVSLPLAIPSYQRIYCWEENNVKCLLDDIFSHLDNQGNGRIPYRLGTIILHYNNNKYDIIDGQQRLITLSLLINELVDHSFNYISL